MEVPLGRRELYVTKEAQERPCPVCGGVMGTKVKALSYGGLCCLSCRAFFRRAHQDTKFPGFKCFSNGKCLLDPASCKRCPKCRLDVCLQIGMRPELVLTYEEKNKRFRKALSKKAGVTGGNKMLKSPPRDGDPFKSKNEPRDVMQICNDGTSIVRYEHVDPAPTNDIMCMAPPSDMMEHQEQQSNYVKQPQDMRSILIQALQANLECFYSQAMKHKNGFLDQDDWTDLYQHNRRLFINFIFGRYLVAPNAESKIMWLKPCNQKYNTTHNLSSLGFYDSEQALSNLQLFGNDGVMQNVYEGFARSLSNVNISPQDKGHLAQILFFYQGNLYLRNKQAVCDRLTSAFGHMSEMGRQKISLQDFYEVGNTLNAMASMFDHSSLARDFSSDYFKLTGPQDNSVTLGISSEESLWLMQRKNDMFSTKNTVPFGLEVTMEFSNFALAGKAISHDWNVKTNQVFKERLWRFFKMHSEFEKFSDKEQSLIWSSCYDIFASLLAVRLGGAPMNDQAEFMFSSQEIAANTFLKVIHQSSPKEAEELNAIDMKDVFPGVPRQWNDTARRVKAFVRRKDENMTFFALLTSALFDLSPIGNQVVGESKARWEALGNAYRQIISRQFARTQPDFEERLSSAITDLKMLSLMIMVPVSQD